MKKTLLSCDDCNENEEEAFINKCPICSGDFCSDCENEHFNSEHKEELIKFWIDNHK
jgi:hypothetical protein